MSLNDPLANVLSLVLSYDSNGKPIVCTKNNSKVIRKVLSIMRDNGFIGDFEEVSDSPGKSLKINLLGKINKCGVIKPRFSVAISDIEKFEKRYLLAKDFGIIILSTNKGLMTNVEAREKNIGGSLVSYCY